MDARLPSRANDGYSSTFLGSGFYGEPQLSSDARRSLVVKRMKLSAVDFLREVQALAKVQGIEGVQQIEAIMVEQFAIASRYADFTL